MAQVEFSLEEYLKDPLRKVVTRDGREVRIRCTDMDGVDNMVIVGLVRDHLLGKERPLSWTKEGQYFPQAGKTDCDLFFEDSKELSEKRGWVNVHKSPDGEIIFGVVRKSKEEAEQASRGDRIDTIEVSWKE